MFVVLGLHGHLQTGNGQVHQSFAVRDDFKACVVPDFVLIFPAILKTPA